MSDGKKFECSVCGKAIDQDEYDDHDGMCWDCWDDHLTEESDTMFGEPL